MTNGNSRLEQIEALQLQAQQQINANIAAIAALTAKMDQAAVERAELRADAEADRKMIWAALEQHDVVLARLDRIASENQQILNYLYRL